MNVDVEANITTTTTNVTAETNIITNMNVNATVTMMPATAAANEDTENLHQPDKYNEALSKYNTVLKDEEVAAQTAHIIEKYVKENDTVEVKKFLFHCIDLTTSKCTDSEPSVMKFTQHVNDFVDAYPELDNVAAICVYPNMAEIVNDTLEADNVKIACVSGGFPFFTNIYRSKGCRNSYGTSCRSR